MTDGWMKVICTREGARCDYTVEVDHSGRYHTHSRTPRAHTHAYARLHTRTPYTRAPARRMRGEIELLVDFNDLSDARGDRWTES